MSEFRIELAPLAEQDIADGFAWYEEHSLASAEEWRQRVFKAIEYVGRSPSRQAKDSDGNQSWRVARSRHRIIYTVTDTVVTILAIAHHSRKPSYWRVKPT